MQRVNMTVFRRVFFESGLSVRQLARHRIRQGLTRGILDGAIDWISLSYAASYARLFDDAYNELIPQTRKIDRTIWEFVEVE